MRFTLSTHTPAFFEVEGLQGSVRSVDLVTIVLSLVILTGLISIIGLVVLPIGIQNLIIISIIS